MPHTIIDLTPHVPKPLPTNMNYCWLETHGISTYRELPDGIYLVYSIYPGTSDYYINLKKSELAKVPINKMKNNC
jgi:hypothetical protein